MLCNVALHLQICVIYTLSPPPLFPIYIYIYSEDRNI